MVNGDNRVPLLWFTARMYKLRGVIVVTGGCMVLLLWFRVTIRCFFAKLKYRITNGKTILNVNAKIEAAYVQAVALCILELICNAPGAGERFIFKYA